MSDPDRDKIARRHPAIQQDPLPFKIKPPSSGERKLEKRQITRSIRTAPCPQCCGPQGSNKKIGVTRDAVGIERFRDHDHFTVGGRRIPCSGSGTEAPARTGEG
jgi:hypothetical protein